MIACWLMFAGGVGVTLLLTALLTYLLIRIETREPDPLRKRTRVGS